MEQLDIVVEGSARTSEFCPLSAEVDLSPAELEDCILLERDRPVPFQVTSRTGGAVIHWIAESIAPGQRATYRLREGDAPAGSRVRVTPESDGGVSVHVGGELLTRYLYGDELPKPCLYPLMGPYGRGVTRAYPQEEVEGGSTDHVHHRSVWVAWGDVNGANNWEEGENGGRMVHRYFEATEGGPVFGRIAACNDWVDAEGNRLMQDRVEYRFYDVPPSLRLIDAEITFYASEGEVRFGDTKEGGIMSVRVATPLEGQHSGCIRNAVGGIAESETWGRRAGWCDYSGLLEGNQVGIAVFDHPANLRYPTYWHVRDYGLMTANPFGLSFFVGEGADGSYLLPEGENLSFRYRLLVHAGGPGAAGVRERYLDWLFPPSVAVGD